MFKKYYNIHGNSVKLRKNKEKEINSLIDYYHELYNNQLPKKYREPLDRLKNNKIYNKL